jgi:outer membrane cobalamin receptor
MLRVASPIRKTVNNRILNPAFNLRIRGGWVLPVCSLAAVLRSAAAAPSGDAVPFTEVEVRASPFSNTALSSPAVEVLLDGETIRHAPALSLDGILRTVPGFRLFRRTDSAVAHPTTQGVSLGNVGPNGASRSLVLLDGIPMNDPFGGWVAWNRFLPSSLSGVRLVPQAGVSPWGTASLGGVISLDSRFLNEPAFTVLEASAGDRLRHQSALAFASDSPSGRTRLFGGLQETDFAGYPVIRRDRRGPVDIRASSQTQAFDAGIRQRLAAAGDWNLTLRAQGWQEKRNNGTPLATNSGNALDVSARLLRDGGPRDWASESILFAQKRSFESVFSSVTADRAAETPSLDQYAVPAECLGFLQRLRWPLGDTHSLGAGWDARATEGLTKERFRWAGTAFTREREAGGRQEDAGVYLQDTWTPLASWEFHGAARLEWHADRDGRLREWEIQPQSLLRDQRYASAERFVPHMTLGSKWSPTPTQEWSACAYAGARNPTLNELYRPFRAGDVVTLANPALRPESTVGGEVAAKITPVKSCTLRLRAFENRIEDAVANINLVRGPGNIGDWGFLPTGATGARRENIDSTGVRGLETRVEWTAARWLTVDAGWLASQSKVRRCAVQPSLEGRALPQVPAHQASLQLRGETDRWRWDLVLRWVSGQFDDDANQNRLEAFYTADIRLTRRLGEKSEVFAAVENLTNAEIQTRRDSNGTVAVGTPRMWSAGFRHAF